MGKQGRQNKKTEHSNIGKGKVTEVQVAFLVDRYLSDNNYNQTRSTFRSEASSLLPKSPVQEAPKSLLSLGAILNDYISLKEKKVMFDHDKVCLEHEKVRVQTLLQGMQSVMNAYNSAGMAVGPVIPASSTPASKSIGGCPPFQTPTTAPASLPSKNIVESGNISAVAVRKRKGARSVDEAPLVGKRAHTTMGSKVLSNAASHPQLPWAANGEESSKAASAVLSPPYGCGSNGLAVQGSRVSKCLFSQALPSPQNNSPSPKTPPQGTSSPSDKCTSVPESSSPATCSNNYASQDIAPTHCTVISSQTVTVSPCKQGTIYSVQRNQIITSSPIKTNMKRSNNRDHVKGRLNFDSSDAITGMDGEVQQVSTSESDKEADFFDIDFPNLDAFGPEFSFNDLLDFDLDCGGIDINGQSNIVSSPDSVSGSSHDLGDFDSEASQLMKSYISTATEVVPQKDTLVEGAETLTTMNALTKRVQIISPAKKRRTSDQNCS